MIINIQADFSLIGNLIFPLSLMKMKERRSGTTKNLRYLKGIRIRANISSKQMQIISSLYRFCTRKFTVQTSTSFKFF